jgi:multidrug efflux pump subunit AcrB
MTTLIVFLPLYAMEPAAPGIRSISLAISVMLIVALILNFLFLPPFFLSGAIRAGAKPPAPRLLAELKSLYARYVRRSLLRPLPFLAGYGLALAGCVLAFVLAPKALSFSERDTVLFAQLEFPSGTNLTTVDSRTAAFVQTLLDAPFITRVQSQAKRGKSELSVEYLPSRIDEPTLMRYLKEKAPSVPQGFLFFDEPSPREGARLECAITGYDHRALKTLARSLVQDLVAQDWVTDGVLHFKDDPPALIFRPDMERLFGSKLTLSEVASALRWHVQGPVALKWIQEGREMDLRVFGEKRGRLGREDLTFLPVSLSGGGAVRLAQLGSLQEGVEPARLYRLNRQNAVFFSVTVSLRDLELLTQRIRAVVERAQLPVGYGFVLDQDLRETQKRFQYVWLLFLVAIFLVYVVIAVQTESFQAPLLILSIVPLSVGVPAALLAVFGTALELSVIIGCIILSGMAVNNSILIYDGYQAARAGEKETDQGILKAMFGRLKPLVLTSGTTVIGSVPLLIAARGVTGFSGTLAFVIIFGVTAAVLASLLFLPVLLQFSTLSRRSLRLPSDSSLRRIR